MALSKTFEFGWTVVLHDGAAAIFIPATEWSEVGGAVEARAWCEVRGRSGNGGLLVSPAVQTATDIRNPDSSIQTGVSGGDANDFANNNGVFDPKTAHTSLSIAGKLFIRGGWLVKVTNNGSLAWGAVAENVELFD